MKKYWNKLVFAVIALVATGAVSCGDDPSELPGYYFENFAYIELYPDTNTAVALSAINDYRGVTVNGTLPDFYVKLKSSVSTDVNVELGLDKNLIVGTSEAIPEEAVSFAMIDPSSGELRPGAIVIPAGSTQVKVRPELISTEFATKNQAATTYTASVTIKRISGSKSLNISTNRNVASYPVAVEAYKRNNASIVSSVGSNMLTIVTENMDNPTLSTNEFDVRIRLALPAPVATTVRLEVDPTLLKPGWDQIPLDKTELKVGGTPVTDMAVVIPAGETEISLNVKLLDTSFIVESDLPLKVYSLPLKIVEVEGEQVFISPDNRSLYACVSLVDVTDVTYEKPTVGTIDDGPRDNYASKFIYLFNEMNDPEAKMDGSALFDGDLTTDFDYYGVPYAVAVDLASVRDITGLEIYSFKNADYSPTDFEIYTSDDGQVWTLMRRGKRAGAQPAYYSFSAPITTRYIKFYAIDAKRGVDLTEIYFYFK